MNARLDDDALSWDGDDDPTLDVGAATHDAARDAARDEGDGDAPGEPESASVVPLADGFTAVGKGADHVISETEAAEAAEAERAEAERADAAASARSAPMGNAALIAVGVLGGIYLLYVIGWIVGGLRLQASAGFLVAADGNASPAWTIGNWVALALAALAPIVWFALVYGLTRRSRTWLRWTFLALGVVLLVPWPFVMIGAIGA